MKTTSAVIKLLIFAVIATLATAVLAVTISNTEFVPSRKYNLIFTDAAGLNDGDEVRIAGVRVGEVKGIKLYQGHLAKVTVSVVKDQPLPRSTQAQLRYRNLMGQRYISLTEGSGQGGELPAGGTIPKEQTQPALDLTALFNGFRPLLRAIKPQDVNQLAYQIIQVLQGEGGTVNGLLAHVASLTETLGNRDEVIGRVIDNLDKVIATIDSRDEEVSGLITNLKSLVSGLSDDRHAIGESLVSVNQLISTTNGLLTDVRPSVKTDIATLGHLSKVLAANGGELDKAFADMPTNFMLLDRAASYGSWFNFYLCSLDARIGLPGQVSFNTPQILNENARCKG
ncbi:MCE family protein [Actinoallomurus rhizosphaericola]|uniref:MCE family protein n=1 Tax=Actinoallomurus rhizosphaericola TaxID=2952536 RepID=UPI0020905DCE|nr:MlaD family protein [Actinoallomurus rhizosphaericola]MCO5994661.1 MCE family protein [Actinoallomurus rhizosphaericola]